MNSRLQYFVPLIVILLASLVLHEIAHGYAALKMGDPTAKAKGRLSFNPLHHLDPVGTVLLVVTYLWFGFIFGYAKPVPISPYYFKSRKKGMAVVGLAGPLTNFALAAIFWAALTFLRPYLIPDTGVVTSVQNAIIQILFLAFQLNVVLGVFNLIPIPPLDGSRIVAAAMPRKMYEWWAGLDRYGWLVIIVLILVINNSGGNYIGRAYDGLFHLLLPAYF